MCEHEIINIQNGTKFDEKCVTRDNAMLAVRPELFREWDFEKNEELGFDVYQVTKGSDKLVAWICGKCYEPYTTSIGSRARGTNCRYCAGQEVNINNCLATLRPDLAEQWHPTKNRKTPYDVVCNSTEAVWWVCKLGHEWKVAVKERNRGKGCKFCSNKYVWIGYNDMWTTNPTLASLLWDSNDGYKYLQNSHQRVDWRCYSCRLLIKDKRIVDVNTKGLSCARCSDGIKFPEKVMYSILSYLNIEFKHNQTIEWSKNRKYDFYIPNYNSKSIIIETHGRQHKDKGINMYSKYRKPRNEEEIDKYKRALAITNGIDIYIELDCAVSNLDYIRNSINNSELINLFPIDSLDWNSIGVAVMKSKMVEACEIYNSEDITHLEIAQRLKISDSTVRDYLYRGAEAGLCDYKPNSEKNKKISIKHMEVEVVQLNKKGDFIKEFSSIREAGKSLNKDSVSSISACCKEKSKTAYGYRWMYKTDYLKYKAENLDIPPIIKNYARSKPVVKLNDNLEVINQYSTLTEAVKESNLKIKTAINGISACCRGIQNTAYGFKWMYKDDYDKMKYNEDLNN